MKAIGLIVLGLVIGLIAAISFTRLSGSSEEPFLPPVSGGSAAQIEALREHFDQRMAAMDQRLSGLSSAVDNLTEQMASVEVPPEEVPTVARDQNAAQERARAVLSRLQQEERDRILAEGFTQDRIDWLDRRVEELQMEARQTQLDAAQSGQAIEFDPMQALAISIDPESLLRPEIGDGEYERYLRAKGRPTAVEIARVFASSPAEQGGLRQGDQIVAYGGERVFSFVEINSLAAKRNSSESVLVEISRDGQSMQLTVPGGDLGIDSKVPARTISNIRSFF